MSALWWKLAFERIYRERIDQDANRFVAKEKGQAGQSQILQKQKVCACFVGGSRECTGSSRMGGEEYDKTNRSQISPMVKRGCVLGLVTSCIIFFVMILPAPGPPRPSLMPKGCVLLPLPLSHAHAHMLCMISLVFLVLSLF